MTIQFDVFDLSFIFFIPMFQTISVRNRSGVYYFLQHQTIGTTAGVCAYDRTHEMEKTVTKDFLMFFRGYK